MRTNTGALCCGVVFESDASSAAFLTELCGLVLKRRDQILSNELLTAAGHGGSGYRPPPRVFQLCRLELLEKCAIDLDDVVKSDVDSAVVDRRLSSKFHGRVRAQNLTRCLQINFDIDEMTIRNKQTSYHRPMDVFQPRKTTCASDAINPFSPRLFFPRQPSTNVLRLTIKTAIS